MAIAVGASIGPLAIPEAVILLIVPNTFGTSPKGEALVEITRLSGAQQICASMAYCKMVLKANCAEGFPPPDAPLKVPCGLMRMLVTAGSAPFGPGDGVYE